MSPQTPVLDVLIARDGDAWRLYLAPGSWRPGILGNIDTSTSVASVYPVGRPDVADLKRFAWETDSPHEHLVTADGGVEIVARGRSAITLAVWVGELAK